MTKCLVCGKEFKVYDIADILYIRCECSTVAMLRKPPMCLACGKGDYKYTVEFTPAKGLTRQFKLEMQCECGAKLVVLKMESC